MSTLIKVNRSIIPNYSSFFINCHNKIVDPELELNGPNEFHIDQLFHWTENKKANKNSIFKKYFIGDIFNQLKNENLLRNCLNLSDLLAIKKKGIRVFNSFYKNKQLVALKSVIAVDYFYLCVPCLWEVDKKLVINFISLDCFFDQEDCLILIHKK